MEDLEFQPDTREEALAQEIAELLDDREGLPYYLKAAQRYPEEQLRTMLRWVLDIPEDRIRTSRGALFNWLAEHYGTSKRKGA